MCLTMKQAKLLYGFKMLFGFARQALYIYIYNVCACACASASLAANSASHFMSSQIIIALTIYDITIVTAWRS